ncbi:hypothetical protein N2152v2_002759 [Parachlorella kessleri]
MLTFTRLRASMLCLAAVLSVSSPLSVHGVADRPRRGSSVPSVSGGLSPRRSMLQSGGVVATDCTSEPNGKWCDKYENGVLTISGYCINGDCVLSCAQDSDCGDPACNYCYQDSNGRGQCNFQPAGTACNAGGTCNYNPNDWTVAAYCCGSGGIACDPIISGFDGSVFHIKDAGDFVFLETGNGLKVDVTFTGRTVVEEGDVKESSWTSRVTICTETGSCVTASLPGILPNTTKVAVAAKQATGQAMGVLSPSNARIDMAGMTVEGVVSSEGGQQAQQLWGCHVATAQLNITIYQVWGWKQALTEPELESWAAPFTWLNMEVKPTQRLVGPVTGILGSTYPAELMVKPGASQTSLVADAPAETAAGAGVHGTRRRRKERQLAGASDAGLDAGDLVLSAGSMGMAPTDWHTQRKRS